jgi:hypothetical protein
MLKPRLGQTGICQITDIVLPNITQSLECSRLDSTLLHWAKFYVPVHRVSYDPRHSRYPKDAQEIDRYHHPLLGKTSQVLRSNGPGHNAHRTFLPRRYPVPPSLRYHRVYIVIDGAE